MARELERCGDTRPTDRERLILRLTGALHLHSPSRDDRCHSCPGRPAAGLRHYAEVALDAFLAARAPAPPDAAQALRDAADDLGDTWTEIVGREPHSNVPSAIEAVTEWLNVCADRLAAEPDAATRTVQVEVSALYKAAEHLDSLAQGGTAYNAAARDVRRYADRLRAAADPGTRVEGHRLPHECACGAWFEGCGRDERTTA